MKLKDFAVTPGVIRLGQVTQRFPRERKFCHLDIETDTKHPAFSFIGQEKKGRTLVTLLLTTTEESYLPAEGVTTPTRITFSLPGTAWTLATDGSKYDYTFTALRREVQDYKHSRSLYLER